MHMMIYYTPFKLLTCQNRGYFSWICTWNCSRQKPFFSAKCSKYRSAAGLHPDRLV